MAGSEGRDHPVLPHILDELCNCTNVMLPHEWTHCSSMIPMQAKVSVSRSLSLSLTLSLSFPSTHLFITLPFSGDDVPHGPIPAFAQITSTGPCSASQSPIAFSICNYTMKRFFGSMSCQCWVICACSEKLICLYHAALCENGGPPDQSPIHLP